MGVFLSCLAFYLLAKGFSFLGKKRFELSSFNFPSPSSPPRQFPCLPLISGFLGSGHNNRHTYSSFSRSHLGLAVGKKFLFLTKQPESKRVSFKNFVSCFSLDCLRVQHPMFPGLCGIFHAISMCFLGSDARSISLSCPANPVLFFFTSRPLSESCVGRTSLCSPYANETHERN